MRKDVAIFIELREAPSRFKKDQRVRLLTGALLYSTLAGGVIIFGFLKYNNRTGSRTRKERNITTSLRVGGGCPTCQVCFNTWPPLMRRIIYARSRK